MKNNLISSNKKRLSEREKSIIGTILEKKINYLKEDIKALQKSKIKIKNKITKKGINNYERAIKKRRNEIKEFETIIHKMV